ncbi:MAG: PleD family two-component system response regulator [Pseudomonadota bacterium]
MTARVLVVDDVPPNVKLLEAKLTKEYFDVLTATSGLEALAVAQRELPDIILLDVMMPGMDGFEVCRRLKADPAVSHIPVVMVTALDQAEDKITGLEAGADDFLTKPVKEVALYARVRSLVRLKMMMDELRNRAVTSTVMGVSGNAQDDITVDDARILLIGEDAAAAAKLREAVAEMGEVEALPGSDSAADKAQAGHYDVVVVDLAMQNVDGLRIASRVRSFKETRNIAILVLTAVEDSYRIVKALEIGVNDYIGRPLDVLEIKARIRTQLKRKRFADRLRENLHMSVRLATTDAVTGLYNRHYMASHLATMIQHAVAMRKPLSLAMLDIDFFKQVNDSHGHAAGDEILAEFARRLSTNIRGVDLAARYGGEEFVVIMPECPGETAAKIAERLRQVVADAPFALSDAKTRLNVTVSVGLASLAPGEETSTALLERADEALYSAKAEGRNRVVSASPPGSKVAKIASR